jgi:hypothetical protein
LQIINCTAKLKNKKSKYFILLLEEMREMCPNELDFTTAIEKAKEWLRKAHQRHNENVGLQREKAKVSKSPSSNRRFKIFSL